MIDQLLQGSERGSPGDEKAPFIQLSDPVVFDRVAVSHGQRVVISPGFRVPDEESSVLVLCQ